MTGDVWRSSGASPQAQRVGRADGGGAPRPDHRSRQWHERQDPRGGDDCRRVEWAHAEELRFEQPSQRAEIERGIYTVEIARAVAGNCAQWIAPEGAICGNCG